MGFPRIFIARRIKHILFAIVAVLAVFGALAVAAKAHPLLFGSSIAPSSSLPPSACDTECSLFIEPDAGIAPFITLVRGASKSIDLVMYELEDPAIFAALADAEKRGVAVRVILNHYFYSGGSGFSRGNPNEMAYVALARAGAAVRWSSARFTYTHEKSMVIDGARAFIMSFNLVPKYYPTGRDFGVADTDAADAEAMEAAFDADWNAADGRAAAVQVSPGNHLVWSPGSRPAIAELIDGATRSLEVYNEEMADDGIVAALERAARRGVAVRIVMTWSADWKHAWDALVAAGTNVRTYPETSSGLYIHAKAVIADGARAFVGSENFSATSLDQNRELGIMLGPSPATVVLRAVFEKDWAGAEPFRGG